MNIYHKYKMINNELTCIIYVNYPVNYEFGLDFDAIKQRAIDLSNKIKEYALNLNDKISDDKALLILNGIVIGTLIISNLNNSTILKSKDNLENNIEILQEQETDQTENDSISQATLPSIDDIKLDTDNLELENSQKEEENLQTNTIKNNQNSNTNSINKPNTSSTTTTSPSKENNTSSSQNSNQNTTNNNNNNNNNTNNSTSINSGKKVNLKLNNGSVISIDLEEYIIGVVGAEMPASFNIEALKAQAVAARTYAMDKVSLSQTLTATTSSQCYKTNDELKKDWGDSFSMYYSKIKEAVTATKGQVIKYDGKYIDAVYFSMSNGKTEDAVNVWGNSFSYLKSVDSPYDANLPKTTQSVTIAKSVVSSKLGVTVDSLSQINIVSKTVGDRVNIINICGKDFTGVEVRNKLGLRSTDFSITESGTNFIFTTKGYGHGVGMSQYGANEIGKQGYSYKQILTHYYTGVTISEI